MRSASSPPTPTTEPPNGARAIRIAKPLAGLIGLRYRQILPLCSLGLASGRITVRIGELLSVRQPYLHSGMRIGRANGEGWLRLGEAAAELGVSLNTLRRWSDSGKLTCYRSPGGHRRYRRGDVEALLRAEDTAGPVALSTPARVAPPLVAVELRAPLLALARVAAEGVGVTECRISLPEADDTYTILTASSRTGRGTPSEVESSSGEPLPTVRVVLRTGRRLVIADLGSTNLLERPEAEELRQRGDVAVLAVPLAVDGRYSAVLELVESRAPRVFTGANVTFAEFMARQAAGLLSDQEGTSDAGAVGQLPARRRRPRRVAACASASGPAARARRPAAPRAARRRLRHPSLRRRRRDSRAGGRVRVRRSAAPPRPLPPRRRVRPGRRRALLRRSGAHLRPGLGPGVGPAPGALGAERREEHVCHAGAPRPGGGRSHRDLQQRRGVVARPGTARPDRGGGRNSGARTRRRSKMRPSSRGGWRSSTTSSRGPA